MGCAGSGTPLSPGMLPRGGGIQEAGSLSSSQLVKREAQAHFSKAAQGRGTLTSRSRLQCVHRASLPALRHHVLEGRPRGYGRDDTVLCGPEPDGEERCPVASAHTS